MTQSSELIFCCFLLLVFAEKKTEFSCNYSLEPFTSEINTSSRMNKNKKYLEPDFLQEMDIYMQIIKNSAPSKYNFICR